MYAVDPGRRRDPLAIKTGILDRAWRFDTLLIDEGSGKGA
jgi:hypothetical protein